MKILAAAIQMPSTPGDVAGNLDRADTHLRAAALGGAGLAVLPELFNTGYGLIADYAPLAEPADGPTMSHLAARSREWGMLIAGGFVESHGHHLYDSLGLCTPEGHVHVYRKRNLVFWERFRFARGDGPVVAPTKLGRIGLGVCADMIYKRTWDAYRGRVDLSVISAAWPDFARRETGRKHWLCGHLGPMAATIPTAVGRDLGVPVVFANQVGHTQTTIPLLGTRVAERIRDTFAGTSAVVDGRHGVASVAGRSEGITLAEVMIHPARGPRTWVSMSPSASAAASSASAPSSSA